VVHRVLGQPAVGGEAVGPVSALEVAVVETGGVVAADAVLAAPAAHVRLDDDPVAHLELVDGVPDGDHVPRVLVAEDELAVGRHPGHAGVDDLHVGATSEERVRRGDTGDDARSNEVAADEDRANLRVGVGVVARFGR